MLKPSTANALRSATTRIDVSAATAPSNGQVLTATSSTTATWQTPSGGGGGGEAVTKSITQSSHGFVVGDVLKYSSSTYAKAQGDTPANAETVGIVSTVADANTFTLTTHGYVPTGSGWTPDTNYFLSPTTAGLLTSTEPTTAGQVSKPLFRAVSTTAGYFNNMRGIVVGTSPSITTIFPQSVTGSSTAGTCNLTVNTEMPVSLQNIPTQITVNKISVDVSVNSTAGDIKLTIYTEDGSSILLNETVTVSAGTGLKTFTLGSPLILPADNYYIGAQSIGATSIQLRGINQTVSPFTNLYTGVTSEPVIEGRITGLSAGTPPSTITPSSITAGSGAGILFRLDN